MNRDFGFARFALKASVAALLCIGVQPHPAAAQTPIALKLANCTTNDPAYRSLEMIKAGLDKDSGGRLNVQLFGGCQLGSMQRMIESVQLGTIEMNTTPTAFAVSLSPAFQVTDAPGLIADVRHAERAYRYPKFREKFINVVQNKGLSIVHIWAYSPTAYASNTPIRQLDDFKGLKVRVLGTKMETALMGAMGATGVPIDFGELLTALQHKTVDAVRSSIVVMTALKYHDVAKYVTTINDSVITEVTFANNAFLDKLPKDLRDLIFKVSDEVETALPEITTDFGNKAAERWKAGGGTVIQLSDKDEAEFNRRAQKVADEYLAGNPDTRQMYALFKEAAQATRQ